MVEKIKYEINRRNINRKMGFFYLCGTIQNLNNINNSFENSLIKSFKNHDTKTYDYLNKLYGKIILWFIFSSKCKRIIDKQPLILKSLGDVHFRKCML